MAEIIDFKVEKKRILKKWEAEIEVDIKAQDIFHISRWASFLWTLNIREGDGVDTGKDWK